MNQSRVTRLHSPGERVILFPTRRHVAQPGSAPSWGVGGRRFKSSRADQINILDVSDTYGSPTETRILSEFAGFLLSVSFGIDRLQPDVLAIPLVI